MAAKKKTSPKATPRSAAKKARKITARTSRKAKKTSAKRSPLPKRAKARTAAKSAPKKAARKVSPKRRAAAKPAAKAKPALKAKPAPKAKPAATPKPAPKAKPIQRRDATGHLDPKYASDLRALMQPHEDDTTAFLGGNRSTDALAEELGEEVVETATSGEYEAEDALNQSVPEERGGPFVPSTAGVEFGDDPDESNPKGTKREPFPTS